MFRMSSMCRAAGIGIVLAAFLPLHLPAQEPVENVIVAGNERILRETILHHFRLRPGYAYDEKAVDMGIKTLWDTGFFADIEVALERGEKGWIILLSVKEYPVVTKMVFETGKRIKESQIRERLQEEKLLLVPYSVYDPQKMHEIKQAIERMLEEKGFDHASVRIETRKVGKFEVEARCLIREGPRYRIGEILFKGSPRLDKKILLDAFRFNRKHVLLSWLRGKDFLRETKLDEDLESLRQKYRAYGYPEARIGEALIEEFSKKTVWGAQQRMKRIVIPVEAGKRYVLGRMRVSGNEHVSGQEILQLVPLKKGDTYDGDKIDRALDEIRALYRNKGYLFAQILSLEHLDAEKRNVDVAFHVREGDLVHLRRLRFRGNTFTRDPVLRREMLVLEQQVFRLDLFRESLQKLAYLGLAKLEQAPEIKPLSEDPAFVDIDLNLVERYRNEWQLTGGYSGYQGSYLGGSVALVDFLGVGEQMNLMLEFGKRTENYELEFSKPYLFDKFFSLHSRLLYQKILYPDKFERRARGVQMGLDAKIKGYWLGGLWYSRENVKVRSFGAEGRGKTEDQSIGSVRIFLSRDTVDNPFFPSKGMRLFLSCGFAGSELGSDVQFVRPEWEGAFFTPSMGNHVFGIHLAYKTIIPLRNSEIPFWERYYLGGERSIRGYDVYSVGPRDGDGLNVGGEKALVAGIEYIVPVLSPVYGIFFFDAGNAFRYDQKVDLTDLYWSSGLEMRLRIPHVPVPLRLIFAYNNRLIAKEDSYFAFRIAFGASF